MTRSYSSSSEDPWSTDSDSDSTYSDHTPNFSNHRNSAGRHQDHADRPPPRHRGRHGKTKTGRRHGQRTSSTRSSNSRSGILVKAAITLLGKSILKAIKNNLEQRRPNGQRSIYTASDRFKDLHDPPPPPSPSLPARDPKPHPRSKARRPPPAPTIPTMTSLANVSATLHRSLTSLSSKADALHQSLSTSPRGPTNSPTRWLKREGAELLAHCNSLRDRVGELVGDVEGLLTEDHEGRRRGSVSKGLRELWKDADGLRRGVDGFVGAQRGRLGREVFGSR